MKTYYDYINELSLDEVRKGLLGYGMFADKLPNFLTAEMFYLYCEKQGFSMCYSSKSGWDYIRYNSVRNTNVPRALGIPVPFAYYNLCKCLVGNWDAIKIHFRDKTRTEKFKRSQIHIQKHVRGPHLFEMSANYADQDADTMEIIQKQPITCFYKVETDISTCFPSIYSHALAWALVGKKEAKNNCHDNDIWYNKLDKCSRQTKYNETCGLLIGPHTSNLLSEIILTSVDSELSKYNYVRYIDDITCYVKTEDEAEKFVLDVAEELKKYDLSLNVKKTKITRLPISSDADWRSALTNFYIGNDLTDDGKQMFRFARLKSYIELCINQANMTHNLAVYTYMLKVVSGYFLGKKALNYYIDTMHHLLLLYPYLVHWYDEYIFEKFSLSVNRIKEIANDLYKIGIDKRNYEACSFALSWSIKYKFDIVGADLVENAKHSEDCILLLLTYIKMNHLKNKAAQKELEDIATGYLKNDMDRYWLFVYEVLPLTQFQGDYKCLKKNKITFLQPKYQLIK